MLVIAQQSHGSDLTATIQLPRFKTVKSELSSPHALLKRFYAPAMNLHVLYVTKSCKTLNVYSHARTHCGSSYGIR